VRNERTANEIYRGSAKGALKNPYGLIYLVRHCCNAQLVSSRNSDQWFVAVPSYNRKKDLSVSGWLP
jgi:squalene cyclase